MASKIVISLKNLDDFVATDKKSELFGHTHEPRLRAEIGFLVVTEVDGTERWFPASSVLEATVTPSKP